MCERQMLIHVKIEESPDSASIQSNAACCLSDTAKKARKPSAEAMQIEMIGRPLRSMYASKRGA